MKVDVYNQKGAKTKTQVDVADSIISSKINDKLLSQYVYIYLSNQREPISHTKQRGEVSGGGRKPHRQKGTGRARAGSIRSPIWRGGGITFGPTNERNWKKNFPKKMRKIAMRSAFTKVSSADMLRVIDKIEFSDEKLTKQAEEIKKAFGSKKLTIITADNDLKVRNAFSNLKDVDVVRVGELNAYTLLSGGLIVIEEKALNYLDNWK